MKIALFGTGLMGKPMAQKIKKAGFELTVYNRTKSKAEPLAEEGIAVANSVKEAVEKSDKIITMLSDYNAVVNILFSENIDFSGKTIIQMSTILPKESELVRDRITKKGGSYFEAPVLGSVPQIEEEKLIVLVGSTKEQFEEHKKIFESFGGKIVHIGDVGKAAAIKLSFNQLIASEAAAFSMSLGYILEKGVKTDIFMDILRVSPLYAKAFDGKLNNYLNRDFTNPHFPLKHLLKDVRLIQDDMRKVGINTLPLDGVKDIIKEGLDENLSDMDYSSLYNVIHPKKR